MRVSGILALVLFLLPTIYAIKYVAVDAPRETALINAYNRAAKKRGVSFLVSPVFDQLHGMITVRDFDHVPLLTRVAQLDPDPVLRRQAVITLGEILLKPKASMERPFEALGGKAALAQVAAHDQDPEVLTEARKAIDAIAQNGAVVRR